MRDWDLSTHQPCESNIHKRSVKLNIRYPNLKITDQSIWDHNATTTLSTISILSKITFINMIHNSITMDQAAMLNTTYD